MAKPEEAVALYREILESDPEGANTAAQSGLTLALFDAGKRDEAEAELVKSVEQNPQNFVLLVGAAYWYATKNEADKTIELAQQALSAEPRYIWSYIALARGFLQRGDPLAAERTLLTARSYGRFPTLEYELASVRMASGFYRDAAEGLSTTFTLDDGTLKTKLGGRVENTAKSFSELLAAERRASIFQYSAAIDPVEDQRLKSLLKFSQKLAATEVVEEGVETSADEFISGEDNMKFHRQIFAATQLLEKKKSLPKVLEITKNAVGGVDSALNVSTPSAAILADALYEGRKIALARGESVIVPDIPKQTLSRIIRGRIEEIAGWTLFQQEKNEEAISKLRLAITVLPKNSVYSRSTMWKLGTVLESEGKPKEALEAYIKGYSAEEQNAAKKIVIENLYAKLNGNLQGLEERLRNNTADTGAVSIFTNKPEEKETVDKDENETPEETADKANEEEKAALDIARVPSRVPIAEVAPTPNNETPEPNKGADEEKTNEPDQPGRETTNGKPDEKKTAAPGNSAAETILGSESGINILPPLPQEKDSSATENKTNSKEPKTSNEEAKPPLFDPIVINVPDSKKAETDKPANVKTETSKTPKGLTITTTRSLDDGGIAEEALNLPEENSKDVERNLTVSEKKAEPKKDQSDKPEAKAASNAEEALNLPDKTPQEVERNRTVSEKKVEPKKDESDKTETKAPQLSPNDRPNAEETLNLPAAISEEKKTDPVPENKAETDGTGPGTSEKPKPEGKTTDTESPKEKNPESKDQPVGAKSDEPKPADSEKPTADKDIKAKDDTPSDVTTKPDSNKETPVDKPAPGSDEKTDEDVSKDSGVPPLQRPRVVPEADDKPCEIIVSQDIVSIINNGGSLGVLVGLEAGKGDPRKLKAVSSSPEDVEVAFEPDIGASSDRAFFVVKSVSQTQGLYKVTFEAPCGKRTIDVRVR